MGTCAKCYKVCGPQVGTAWFGGEGRVFCSKECRSEYLRLDERASMVAACPIQVAMKVERKQRSKTITTVGIVERVYTSPRRTAKGTEYQLKARVKWHRISRNFGDHYGDVSSDVLVSSLRVAQ